MRHVIRILASTVAVDLIDGRSNNFKTPSWLPKGALLLVAFAMSLAAQDPQFLKEYIRVGNRIVAIENTISPTAVSISPNSGSGMGQVFSATYSNPSGYAQMTEALLQVQTNSNNVGGCYAKYNLQSNALYLADDMVTVWQGPVTPGSQTSVQNGQCVLSGATSSVPTPPPGNNLTVNYGLGFKTSFIGSKYSYMSVRNTAGAGSGWQTKGSWIVSSSPAPVSVSPASGTGLSQVFTATYTDAAGYADMADALFLIQTGVNGVNSCYVKYNVQANAFYLINDPSSAWQGPVTPGSQTNLENSQCVLSGAASTVSGSGNNLTLNFSLEFKTAFSGARSTYMYVSNVSGAVSGWQTEGSWTVAATAQPPGSLAVSPSAGSGASGNFAFSGVSVNGFEYIDSVQMLFNWTVDGTDACYVQYYRSANAIYLVNDQGNQSLGGYAPGSANTIQNSQCTIDVSRTVVTGSFDTLTVSPYITFKSSFPGPQGVFTYMSDIGGLASGWQQVGSWTAYAASPQVPTPTVSPASGAGMNQVFTFHTSDVNGYKYVAYEQILINSSINATSACSMVYYRGWNVLFLANDANNSWGSGAVLGTSGTLSNSQCSINISNSSMSGSGNDLYVNLAITFTSAFGGARNSYMYVTDHAWQVSGWQQMGAWIVSTLTPVSVSPASGTGAYQSFSVSYFDSAGYTDISDAQFLVQTSVNGVNACYLRYNVQANGFYLTDDAASYWQGPVTPGTAGSVQNSRCVLTGNTSSVSHSGGNLTATFGLSFTSAFSGSKNTYAYVNTVSGPVAGWLQLGMWTVP